MALRQQLFEPTPIEKLVRRPALHQELPNKTAITLLQALRKPIRPRRVTELAVRPGFKPQDRQWYGFTKHEMRLLSEDLLEPVPVKKRMRIYEIDKQYERTGKFKYKYHEIAGLATSEKGFRLLEGWSKRKSFKPYFDGYMRPDDLISIQARAVRAKMFDDETEAARRMHRELRSMLQAHRSAMARYEREKVKVLP